MNPSWIHQSTQGENAISTARLSSPNALASKPMTDVISFGGTSLCRTESLIKSEIPKATLKMPGERR